MEQKIFHKLVDPREVIPILEKYIELKPLGIEKVKIEESLGRVLAEDVYAPIDYPPFDRSIVDGYAVRSIDVAGADELSPVKLRLKGSVRIGVKPDIEVGEGEAVEIPTGAVIPRGADSVVMVEYTERRGNEVIMYRSTTPRENISIAGSDISAGDIVATRGTLITSELIAVFAGLGIEYVKVYRKPRIAVYSIGDELKKPGEELDIGKVYDVNGYLITSVLKSVGTIPHYKGILPDDYEVIKNSIEKSIREYDVVITSGGTSAGKGDLVYRVFNELGEPGVIIHGLKVKPGKPTVFAVIGKKLVIGLPGFPLSCYMVLDQVVKPIIMKLSGYKTPHLKSIKARIAYRIKKPLGITWFLPVALVKNKEDYTAYPVSLESGSLLSLLISDGYLVLPSGIDTVTENTTYKVYLFKRGEDLPELNIIGSNDYLLYHLLVEGGISNVSRVIPVGSTGGWLAAKRGEADIAPTHLLDEETLTYNKPFLEKYGLKNKAVLIKGYSRLIGIMTAPGNPKNIKSVRDFLREDVIIVNRTRGSGTRVYLDYLLKSIAMEEGVSFHELVKRIKGYFYEVKTHTAVATAIKQGRADAGIGLGYVAKLYGLDFIPLTWEEYDFLVPRDKLTKPLVTRFIELLRNRDFMEKILASYKGYYRIHDKTGYPIE